MVPEPLSAATGLAMSEGLGYAPDHVFYALLGLTKETQLRGILGIQVRPSPTIFYLL